jgi:hypothetical protein
MTTDRRRMMVGAALCATVMATGAGLAHAKRMPTPVAQPAKVKGAKLTASVAPDHGFVDSPLAFDGAGGRLLYVHTDAAELCELVVLDLATGAEVARVDISGYTTTPVALSFVGDGDRFLVVSRIAEDAPAQAALIDIRGKVVRKFGPATAITAITYDGQAAVSLYSRREKKTGKLRGIEHSVEVFALATGKRLGKRAKLVTNLDAKSKKLDFKINHWLDGYTRAVGMVGGEYDKVEDQRAPDARAIYDLPAGVFASRTPVANVIDNLKQLSVLAKYPNEHVFARVSDNLASLERYADGAATTLSLAESFRHYDPTSLVYQAGTDGRLYFTLTIDPVNPDAAARKRAVPVWIDLYEVAAGSSKAIRRARLAPPRGPGIRWIATPGFWVVVPRHVGFERGGPRLDVIGLGT